MRQAITKEHILHEIRRTATANGGAALGRQRFYAETGIKENDWLGRYWARWNDAVKEAGFEPNALQGAYDERLLLESLITLARELGRFPARTEIQLRGRDDPTFPTAKTFQRLGRKAQLASRLASYCEARPGFEDVIAFCGAVAGPPLPHDEVSVGSGGPFGHVYLLKSGRYHKIGHTNAVGRRERELAIQLPERAAIVHSIKTDDPEGIEAYWHRRFQARRKNGEWFELTAGDVAAFTRRKFM